MSWPGREQCLPLAMGQDTQVLGSQGPHVSLLLGVVLPARECTKKAQYEGAWCEGAPTDGGRSSPGSWLKQAALPSLSAQEAPARPRKTCRGWRTGERARMSMGNLTQTVSSRQQTKTVNVEGAICVKFKTRKN